MSDSWSVDERNAIAIVGMAGRFPGAANVDELWRNLRGGVESIVSFTDEELAAAGVDPETYGRPDYVRRRAPLDGAELFDAALFGISPREAEMIDPQQRLFLECAFEALESAGYDPQRYGGAIGIFGGTNISSYLGILYSNPARIRSFGVYNTMLANDKDYLTSRVAYKLNLRGPAVTVQTACSTSLVAVHLACQSLLNGECDLALAGGVGMNLPERGGYVYEPHGISSPDGHCRAFDAQAQGTVGGSGVGLVVLRRLAAARAEGDSVLAVIRGTAINNDGSTKISYTAPSVKAQARVVAEALAVARVEPDTIGFVEAHGTGTSLGDPVEVAALTRAFRGVSRKGYCALGSLKTNIGHLDAAAGVAGLIKTVQALRHGEVPPTLHFQTPNPQIDFASSPFFVNGSLIEWPLRDRPRRAGVSSLGIGGTNAHVVLEEAPADPLPAPARPAHLLVLSANTASALEAVTERAARFLRENPQVSLADAAYTWQVGRRIWPHRRVLVVRTAAEAVEALESRSPLVTSLVSQAQDRPVCFLFSGQGSQYAGMGADLYHSEPVFQEQVDLCARILAEPLGRDLRQVLFAEEGEADLTATELAQPALFTIEYALARLWMAWGVTPRALLGHSIGEYVAACLAGVFSLEEALRLVATRGRLMQRLSGGAMLAVPLPASEVGSLLGEDLALAAVNGPALCVVAGPEAAIAGLREDLARRGVEGRPLHTSHAFHSRMVEPVLEEFEREVRRTTLRPGSIPYLSNVSGTWQTAENATDPAYWVRHMRQTVLFGPALEVLLQEPEALLLEVGPGDALATLARRHPARRPEQMVVASMRRPGARASDLDVALAALGQLWLAGVSVDWQGLHGQGRRQRLRLPTYPFERQPFWVERGTAPLAEAADAEPSGKSSRVEDWLYTPAWTRSRLRGEVPAGLPSHRWLLLLDDLGCGEDLARSLTAAGQEVVCARQGTAWTENADGSFTLDSRESGHPARLVSGLVASGRFPDRVVHLSSLTASDSAAPSLPQHESPWFYHLLSLAEALGRQSASHAIDLIVITNRILAVSDDEELEPEKAALLGLCKVIPQEYPDISCRLVDVALPPSGSVARPLLSERLLDELVEPTGASVVAHRGAFRQVQTFRRLETSGEGAGAGLALRQGGVYLITGGLGQIGLALAADLARAQGAKLVLLGRSPLPPRWEWEDHLAARGATDPLGRKLSLLSALEKEGAEILTLVGDVADPESVRAAHAEARARFGAIHGVFHAAGNVGPGAHRPLQDLTPEWCAAQFGPKLRGLAVLAEVFRGERLDFLVAFSSLSTVLGGLGYGAYAAANACMDAFAHELSRTTHTPCLCIDWDAWRFDEPVSKAGIGSSFSDLALSPEEGIAALRRLLALGAGPQVIVSTGDLQARIDQWVGLLALRRSSGAADGEAPLHERPGLTTPYVAPRNELEEALVETWQELLGIKPVGVHDNFFDLGGHSLLGIQLNARLRRMFEVDVPLQALFDSPTIAQLAEVVEDALIGDIDGLSDEEAESLLAPEPRLLEGETA